MKNVQNRRKGQARKVNPRSGCGGVRAYTLEFSIFELEFYSLCAGDGARHAF